MVVLVVFIEVAGGICGVLLSGTVGTQAGKACSVPSFWPTQ